VTSKASRVLASTAMAIGGCAVVAGPAAADPVYYNGSAEAVINALESDGYNVVINWLNGYDVKSLSVCWVENVNNPDSYPREPGAFTTVYVDVRCPNDDYY
jgi:hypothetical protein